MELGTTQQKPRASMAERQTILGLGLKPVPMKLFATWEVDRTAPSCIPRVCNVTITRLQLNHPLSGDYSSVTLAVKMQSSKRILRSNEIPLPAAGLLDAELQLTFTLQYPHFIKREGNSLQVLLQRRKRYKNRTILGFKTIAVGFVNMCHVLQRPVDRELELFSEDKEKSSALARVTMVSLSSQPVDNDDAAADRNKHFILDNADRSVDLAEYSDEDEDFSSPDEGSDSEPILEDGSRRSRHLRGNVRSKSLPPNARQRNLKQRFIALLKRFKVPEALQALDQDQELDSRAGGEVEEEIEDLFNELEDLSDSGPEVDTISITSTPKPSLRPYFSSSRTLVNDGLIVPGVEHRRSKLKVPADKIGADRLSDESSKRADSDHMENWTDQEQSDPQITASSPPKDDKGRSNKAKLFTRDKSNMSLKEKKGSSGNSTPRSEKVTVERTNSAGIPEYAQPRKVVLEQLNRFLPPDDSQLPEHLTLINSTDSHGAALAGHLVETGYRVIATMIPADVRAAISILVNKIQKYCNSNAKAPGPVKIIVIGSDSYVNYVVRPYVEHLSAKPPDFQNHLRFLIIPLAGISSLSKYLASIDSLYSSTFASDTWKETIERWEKTDLEEVVNCIKKYLSQAQCTVQLPIAEAMLTYKEKSGDDESTQAFVPFLMDVRLGSGDVTSLSLDMDEMAISMPGSPPSSGAPSVSICVEKPRDNTTPPSSPNISSSHMTCSKGTPETSPGQDLLDLQVDYWLIKGVNREDKEKDKFRFDSGKCTVKTSFRTLQVARLAPLGIPPSNDPNFPSHHLTFSFATKEKKQRIMRLGKKKEKEKETESRREVIDGVCRLLASTRNQPFRVSIDSVEWTNVKFFQLSSQWQTQIKSFPVALFTVQESCFTPKSSS